MHLSASVSRGGERVGFCVRVSVCVRQPLSGSLCSRIAVYLFVCAAFVAATKYIHIQNMSKSRAEYRGDKELQALAVSSSPAF